MFTEYIQEKDQSDIPCEQATREKKLRKERRARESESEGIA
jgi:hypothetical protein